jgi:hypothetical protein
MRSHGRTFLLGVVLSLFGCYTPTTSLRYAPASPPLASPARWKLAVHPFEDLRPPREYPCGLPRGFLTYIPLLPGVGYHFERLDETYLLNAPDADPKQEHFTYAVARALADDLQASQMFQEVRFVEPGEEASEFDFVLGGRLLVTDSDQRITSYFLGAVGVLLWILPIPVGSHQASVSVKLALTDRDGRLVWSHSSRARARRLFNLYTPAGSPTTTLCVAIPRYGANSEGIDGDSLWAFHAEALRRAGDEAKRSLAEFVGTVSVGPP